MPITNLTLSGEFYQPSEKMPEENSHVRAVTEDEVTACMFSCGCFEDEDEGWVIRPLYWSYDVTIKEVQNV